MDFAEVLRTCEDPRVGLAVLNSVGELFNRDLELLATKLAQYVQPYFPALHVDVEYNRMGQKPKKVTWSEKPDEVYPDIIVHVRQTETNVLAIELKKDSNPEKKEKDILKLRAYRRELGYRHALFIRLGIRDGAGSISECEWV